MSRQPSVYLAGPDIFRKDAEAFAQWQKEICEKYGIIPMHPMDNNLDIDFTDTSIETRKKVYEADMSQMLEADIICANMNTFRGSEPDSGTCFEAGFFAGFNEALKALGMSIPAKPLYGYINTPSRYKERANTWNTENPDKTDSGSDWNISGVEMHVNLMMEVPMHETGAFITSGFEDCIAQIAEDFKSKKFKIAA
jgi:nucleoside 2-deoxyribosyltransferase